MPSFLGVQQREVGPLDDVEPLVVALAHGRSERLLGDDLGQHDMVVRRGQRQADAVEARLVGGVDVAAAGVIGGVDLFELFEDDRVVLHLVRLEIVGEVELGRGAALHADGGARKLQRGIDARQLLGVDHEALAVIVGDADEVQAERRIAVDGPGGVARQDIDFARLQRGETLLGAERRELDLGAVAEDGGRDRAAEIHIDALPVTLVVRRREAGQTGVTPHWMKPFALTSSSVSPTRPKPSTPSGQRPECRLQYVS